MIMRPFLLSLLLGVGCTGDFVLVKIHRGASPAARPAADESPASSPAPANNSDDIQTPDEILNEVINGYLEDDR